MTASGRPGRPVLLDIPMGVEHIFARGADDQLLYIRDRVAHGLEGRLFGDPTAVLVGATPHVFAHSEGGRVLHWFEDRQKEEMVGPFYHGWLGAYDPVAVTLADESVAVFARGLNDELMRWGLTPQGEPIPGVSLEGSVGYTPAVVLRGGGEPDVFTVAPDGGVDWHSNLGWERLPHGGGATGAPVAITWSPGRLDVVVPSTDPDPAKARLLHFGWSAGKAWFGPDESPLGKTEHLAFAVAEPKQHAHLFARDTDGHLQMWHWDGQYIPADVGWEGPVLVSDEVLASPPGPGLVAWLGDGTKLGRWRDDLAEPFWEPIEIDWGTEEPVGGLEQPVAVDLLLSRPADLLRLGVSWSGFELVDGDPPTLVPGGEGPPTLRLVLPPQHIAEQVLREDEAFPPANTVSAGIAGPSQLVFDVAAVPITLTTAGVLAAAREAPLRGREEDGTPNTFLELPWELLVSPDGARATHPLDPVAQADVVALWRTSLRSDSGDLEILRAGGDEGFIPALNAPLRQTLAAQSSPAHFERLELSSLGGTLRATGDWDSVKWQHDATLGRDNRVRVDIKGLLYPYGHPAIFTTITERHLTDELPVGVLRQRAFITVLGPTRALPDDGHARAFPFDEVKITTTTFENVEDDWSMGTREPKPSPPLLAAIAAKQAELGLETDERLRIPIIERLESLEEQVEALREVNTAQIPLFFCPRVDGAWVEFPLTCKRGEETVSFATPMLFVADEQLPETPLWPAYDTLNEEVLERLAKEWAEVRSGVPDPNPPEPGASVLRDRDYAGTVTLSGRSLDLFHLDGEDATQPVHRIYVSGEPAGRGFRPQLGPAEAVPSGVTQPSWGIDVELPSLRQLLPDSPEAHRALTAFSEEYLQGEEAPDVIQKVIGPAEGILDEAGKLVDAAGDPVDALNGIVVDFTGSSDRSGGLVAPKVLADGLSLAAGPVNVDGLKSLDPTKMFDSAATLLGFPLTDLLGAVLGEGKAPTITTDLSGPQPVTTMTWPPSKPGATPNEARPRQELALKAPFGPFSDPPDPKDPPTLALEVRTVGTDVRTDCSVCKFSLSFPTVDPLLTLKFGEVRYLQEAGQPPALEIHELDASFSGALDLLTALQKAVDLKGAGPTIRAEGSAIVASYVLPVPDVEKGAFVMRNLNFNAAIRVPFGGDPVVVTVGFASRAMPFGLSVMMFGGGGYVDVEMDHHGLRRLEIALEFGASVGVDFVIARGEAHVLGGIRFELLASGEAKVVGYLRIGGSLEVLGLVSVSVELVLSLGYETTGNRLVGRATLVIEIDLTIFSDSVELDSGEWTIAGGDPARRGERRLLFEATGDPYLDLVREHRAAFQAAADA